MTNNVELGYIWCQVEALFLDMFWNFYLVKQNKIDNNSTTPEAR
jgi:hypothetical protein